MFDNTYLQIEEKLKSIEAFKPSLMAKSVLRLSDFYINNPTSETPWNEKWVQIAYLSYYFPLGLVRNQAVIKRASDVGFFEGIKRYVDWGCGPGPSSLMMDSRLKGIGIESSRVAQSIYTEFNSSNQVYPNLKNTRENDLLVMSYSMTESDAPPEFIFEFDHLILIEPSTREDGRRLLEFRNELMASGYWIWAPCTHQLECPLLKQSKRDWCHDRVEGTLPAWHRELDKLLPMRNRTVTFSYLIASRRKPKRFSHLARLTGDFLKEKGKSKQLVCFDEKRRFLSWMKKDHKGFKGFDRGDLIELPSELLDKGELRGDEIRVPKNQKFHRSKVKNR